MAKDLISGLGDSEFSNHLAMLPPDGKLTDLITTGSFQPTGHKQRHGYNNAGLRGAWK